MKYLILIITILPTIVLFACLLEPKQGPTRGPQGPQGEIGSRGAIGLQGEDGRPGVPGAPGADAAVNLDYVGSLVNEFMAESILNHTHGNLDEGLQTTRTEIRALELRSDSMEETISKTSETVEVEVLTEKDTARLFTSFYSLLESSPNPWSPEVVTPESLTWQDLPTKVPDDIKLQFKGDVGESGEPGGPRGEPGETGKVGPKGDKGSTGDRGPTGPRGSRGEQGDKGSTGDAGPLEGWERIVESDLSDRITKSIEAECTAPRIVVGGGFVTNIPNISMLESFPALDGRGWRVKAVNNGGSSGKRWDLWGYAICVLAID